MITLTIRRSTPDPTYPHIGVGEVVEKVEIDDIQSLVKTFLPETKEIIGRALAAGDRIDLMPCKPSIEEIAAECRTIVERALRDLPNLNPRSFVDLCADNTSYQLDTIKVALIVAGLDK